MSLTRRHLMGAAGAFTALTLASPSLAQAELTAAQRDLLERAESYLQGVRSVRGRFVETGPRGQTSNGAFYLRRPGRMRFEYDAPSRLILVADGTFVHRWDPRLETDQRVPMNQTPLSILLADRVSFGSRYIRVDRVQATSGGGAQITVSDRRQNRRGSLTMVFGGSPYRLREWTVTDAQGGRTRVQLVTLQSASGLAHSLFQDPHT